MLPTQHLAISQCNTAGFRLILALALLIITGLILTPKPEEIIDVGLINDKLAHALSFLTLAFLVHASWPDRAFAWKQILSLAAYGVLLEIIQHFVPNRYFSLLDILADWSGIGLYLLLIPLISGILRKQPAG